MPATSVLSIQVALQTAGERPQERPAILLRERVDEVLEVALRWGHLGSSMSTPCGVSSTPGTAASRPTRGLGGNGKNKRDPRGTLKGDPLCAGCWGCSEGAKPPLMPLPAGPQARGRPPGGRESARRLLRLMRACSCRRSGQARGALFLRLRVFIFAACNRKLEPSVLKTLAWCTMRSITAAAAVASSIFALAMLLLSKIVVVRKPRLVDRDLEQNLVRGHCLGLSPLERALLAP